MKALDSIVTVLAVGAAAAFHQATDQAVKDSYIRFKDFIQNKYPQIDIEQLEQNPNSKAHRIIIILSLRAAMANYDTDARMEMIGGALLILEAIHRQLPEVSAAIGVNLKEIEVASRAIWRLIYQLAPRGHGGKAFTLSRTSRGKFDAAPPIVRDAIACIAFAPQKIALGEQALIQVSVDRVDEENWMHTILVEETDPRARRRGATALSTEITRGSRLMFALNIAHVLIEEPVQEIIWQGRGCFVQFSITAPNSLVSAFIEKRQALPVIATIFVSQDGVVIGRIKFILQIERMTCEHNYHLVTDRSERYQTAFISYAWENRPEVLRRVQMLRLVGIAYFQDLLSIEPGQRWAQQLYRHIDTSDVLFLFWSTPAKQSKWVTKEWRYALRQKGLDFIKPVIIEGPPPVPPPKALAQLNFNDWLLYVIRAEEAVQTGSSR